MSSRPLHHSNNHMTSSTPASANDGARTEGAASGSARGRQQEVDTLLAQWNVTPVQRDVTGAGARAYADCVFASPPTITNFNQSATSMTSQRSTTASRHPQHPESAPALNAPMMSALTSPMTGSAATNQNNVPPGSVDLFDLDSFQHDPRSSSVMYQHQQNPQPRPQHHHQQQQYHMQPSGNQQQYNLYPHLTASLMSPSPHNPPYHSNPYYGASTSYATHTGSANQQFHSISASALACSTNQLQAAETSDDASDADNAPGNLLGNRASPYTFERAVTLCEKVKVKKEVTMSHGSTVSVFLHNQEVWLKFNRCNTEMIITKQGR